MIFLVHDDDDEDVDDDDDDEDGLRSTLSVPQKGICIYLMLFAPLLTDSIL